MVLTLAEAAPPLPEDYQLQQYYAGEPWSSSEYVVPEEFPEYDHAEWAWGHLMLQDAKYAGETWSSSSEGLFFDQLIQEYAGQTWSSSSDGLFIDQLMQEYAGETWSLEEEGLFFDQLMQEYAARRCRGSASPGSSGRCSARPSTVSLSLISGT